MKNIKLIFLFFYYPFYILASNIIKFIYHIFFRPTINIVLLGAEKNSYLEKVILKNKKLNYKGIINIDEIPRLSDIESSEIIYPIEISNKVVNEIFNLKMSGVKVKDSMLFLQEVERKIDINNLSKEWIVSSEGFKFLSSGIEKRVKRFLDIAISLGILIFGAPFMLFTYILVKLDNPKNFINNPAFFKQNRIGMDGRAFQIIKFRSMKLHDPNQYSKYASKKDSRITLVGKFIRKTRLDELPQIYNVLKGDMSIVGPRPEWDVLGRDYEKHIHMYKMRYTVKPGLTGWAQVMYPYGANLEDTKRKLEYDIYYIKHQSVTLDIIILFKTVKVVLFGKGV
ncbi:MAG: sugar transferase [Cetobacterium sp.]